MNRQLGSLVLLAAVSLAVVACGAEWKDLDPCHAVAKATCRRSIDCAATQLDEDACISERQQRCSSTGYAASLADVRKCLDDVDGLACDAQPAWPASCGSISSLGITQ
jgi:hypothetical protein